MADGEGAGGLNLSPSILSDYIGTVAAGSEEVKRLASACIDKVTRPLTSNPLLELQTNTSSPFGDKLQSKS